MFENLKKLEIQDRTSWVDLPDVNPNARIKLRPIGQHNKPYYNGMLRLSGMRKRQLVASGDEVTAEDVEQSVIDDRQLYPLYVIVDWAGVEDAEGNIVPYSLDVCKEFCEVLPSWIFEKIRNHAATPQRFLAKDEPGLPDPLELAGN